MKFSHPYLKYFIKYHQNVLNPHNYIKESEIFVGYLFFEQEITILSFYQRFRIANKFIKLYNEKSRATIKKN